MTIKTEYRVPGEFTVDYRSYSAFERYVGVIIIDGVVVLQGKPSNDRWLAMCYAHQMHILRPLEKKRKRVRTRK